MPGQEDISAKIGILNALVTRLEGALEKTTTLVSNLNILIENHSTRLTTQEKAVEDVLILMDQHDDSDQKNFKELFAVVSSKSNDTKTLEDHEKRLKEIEKWKLKTIGIVSGITGLVTLILNGIGFYIFQVK